MIDLQGKVAVISGGGSGIGKAIAEALAAEGADVVLGSRRADLITQVAGEITGKGRGRAHAVTMDVRDKGQVQRAIAETLERFGRVDILVNNSGLGVSDLVIDCSEDDWDLVMDTNAKGTFLLSQAVLPAMQKQGGGTIINIASQAAKNGYERAGPYCAAKFAVVGFAKALQEEVRQHGIKVHSLCPGLVQVPKPASADEEKAGWLQVDDLAAAALYVIKQPQRVFLEDIGLVGF